jgi:UDPglucose 6-dehydrogenase
MSIVERLLGAGVEVVAFDPVAVEAARAVFGTRVAFAPGPYEALEGAHACVLVTEWNEFRHPDFDRMKRLLAEAVVFDGRNVWDPVRMRAAGFEYHGVGRP